MLPDRRMAEDEVCPVRDELLGELYCAAEHGVSDLVASVAPDIRALLALYCYRPTRKTASPSEPVIMPPATCPWLFLRRCAVQLRYPDEGAGVRPNSASWRALLRGEEHARLWQWLFLSPDPRDRGNSFL